MTPLLTSVMKMLFKYLAKIVELEEFFFKRTCDSCRVVGPRSNMTLVLYKCSYDESNAK
jgi:hypothetical protein